MASTDKFVTEEQLKSILTEVLTQLTINEDNKISKDDLNFRLKNVSEIVDKLNIPLRQVHEFSEFRRRFFIPVGNQNENKSSFELAVSLVNSSKSAIIGIYIPPLYSMYMPSTPVITFMNKDVRTIFNAISIKFIEVSRASQLGVKEYYYEVDLNIDTFNEFSAQLLDIYNHKGITDIVLDIYKGDSVADTIINTIKNVTVDAEVKVGFDDIPDREKLVRSSTMKFYEVVSQEQYQNMETTDTIDSNTVYSIPENIQITE